MSQERKNDFFLPGDQPPPHDLNTEKAVLGAILSDEESRNIVFEKFPYSDKSNISYFFFPAHQRIFRAIHSLYNEKGKYIDILSVSSSLKKEGILETIGGHEYLIELQSNIITTANIENWCEVLKNLAALRKMISVCANAINKCYSAQIDGVEDLLGELESSIFEVRNEKSKSSATKVSEHLVDAVKYLENLSSRKIEATGISTGFHTLDNIIVGLKNQEMVVIAARPSIGKTSLALNIASHIALRKKKSVAFFSLEMSAEQLTRRMLCSIAEISEKDFYDKRFDQNEFTSKWSRITGAASELGGAPFFIDPTPALDINELKARALRLKANHNIDIIFVDYLQLMQAQISRSDNRQVEVSKISVGIKAIAKELNVPVIVLAQLNRQAETQDKPKLSHLRESGAIEQDADIVMFLHRDRDPQKDNTIECVEAELIVEKNRNGQTGIAQLQFFPKIMTFRSLSKHIE
ncbi:MAG TPA: replicative DNA helicase [Lentisphaeria bacterium]|nr:MAG: replicative DNA helicase [Lentisphaerae bacterium GWF2_38_69]HBM17151.1 replicative DNA helicase [Lentisphaeria bacterium]